MFIAPTEPQQLKDIGVVSLMPEDYGVDVLWFNGDSIFGIQRKQFPSDFLASIRDGRLNREYAQMKQLTQAYLLLEGRPTWTSGDMLMNTRTSWSKRQHCNYLASVQYRGIHVVWADTLSDTVKTVGYLDDWTDKSDHNSLDHRPTVSAWGNVTNEDYLRYLYQSLPGIDIVLAKSIVKTLGNIFAIKVTKEELMTVPGIGPGRADNILRVFNHG